MKIAIPTVDKQNIAEHFGRTPYFTIVDTESEEVTTIDNTINKQSPKGAGIQSAGSLIDRKISVLLTPSIGPKAYQALEGEIEVYHVKGEQLSITEALEQYKSGSLEKLSGPVM